MADFIRRSKFVSSSRAMIGGGDPGNTGSGDPGNTGSGDPGDTGSGDPGNTGSGDPGDTGSGDPGNTGSGDPGDTGSGGPGYGSRSYTGSPGTAKYSTGPRNPARYLVWPSVVSQKVLRFRIQRQEQSNWCWAAVAVSIDHYFDPDSKLQQCDVASKVLPIEYPDTFGKDKLPKSDCGCCCQCCCDPVACDQPGELELALQQVHKWRSTLGRALSFAEVQREIDRGRPIGAGITWVSAGTDSTPRIRGHFVAVRGYRLLSSGARQLYVADPLNASGLVDFDEFTFSYYGEGQWTETDLVIGDWA